MVTIAPHGSWSSPIGADRIVASSIGVAEVKLTPQGCYWLERRPLEGGRSVVVFQDRQGRHGDLTPPGFNVRTKVHEYGGGAYGVWGDRLYFVNFGDQCLYGQIAGGEPQRLTEPGSHRYADLQISPQGDRLVAVVEEHRDGGEPENYLACLDLLSGVWSTWHRGHDFYASPCWSADGRAIAWITWDHPQMPWDGSQLWRGMLTEQGDLDRITVIAGGPEESIVAPQWSPDGHLYFVSDRSGWWNLYREDGWAICPMAAEFGYPHWVFGETVYGFANGQRLICTYSDRGQSHILAIDLQNGQRETIATPYGAIMYFQVLGEELAFVGGGPDRPTAIVHHCQGHTEELQRTSSLNIDPAYLSLPEAVTFATRDGAIAHAWYYPPTNPDYQAPAGALPPLVVKSHGGPTAAASTHLNLRIQYWTSRGFGYLDVNYRGSTGYGRAYRQALQGNWGIVDVTDCLDGARYLVEQGRVDGDRLAISGGSAGGYTTLAALTFHDLFKAGASHYGIGDLESLARDTHKFESRYLDQLIGPYPEHRDLYIARSPIHHCDRLQCPVIFFQGLEDAVVPPNQAESMVAALEAKGIPVAYVPFPGEQHGFRQAENIKRALEGEFYFYGRIFGFTPAEAIEPVAIRNFAPASNASSG